jgi:hypothetical protein
MIAAVASARRLHPADSKVFDAVGAQLGLRVCRGQ